jgi:NAD(P)-dependent dehydrogenase (short-subunit alcohol dehydrogenase family)
MKLEGKVAVVAGGGQGIGAGIVKCLAEEGADVAVVDIAGDIANEAAGAVKAMGREGLAIAADLTDGEQVDRSAKEAVDFFGKVDILVNNVGGVSEEAMQLMMEHAASLENAAELPPFMRSGPEVWDKIYQLNLKSHVMMSHAVTPLFIEQRSGKIVNISSDAGRTPDSTLMPYASMKAGDISITWSLALSLAPYGVTVNCVCPGYVYTPLWERGAAAILGGLRFARDQGQALPPRFRWLTDENLDEMKPYDFWIRAIVRPSTPLGVEQTPEDIGRAVVFLVSEDAKNVTGQVLHVNGGQVMR